VLKTLNTYIDGQPLGASPLALLWSSAGRDRRFAFLLVLSFVVHLIFYVALIKLDSWAMMRALARGRHQTTLVKLIEIAPPPERSTLHAAPESLERADVNRLQFDPATADDVHLIQRSPKPTEQRGNSGRLPSADLIEKQLRASRGFADRDRPGIATHQPTPPQTSSIQANRVPQFDEAVTAQVPPTQAAPAPPVPAPKSDATANNAATLEAAPAGARRGNASESTALGLEAVQGQYMAAVRSKIRKANERIMPREWIKDVLRDKVSADFSLVIKRDGQILATRLIRSTGYSVLDENARQAIYTASPFEGFPQAAGNTITFTVTIYFFTL
jgi:outer membrane biosynthesis protein TonB